VLIGYARVSKTEQNLDLQIDALKAAGCDPRRIFTDKQSGAKWDRRGLDAAMSHLREGDTLVVWKMDRLGRTVLQSVQFLNSLHKEKVEFRSLTEGIDTNTPMGKFYFHMAAALAELERDRLIERTNAGLAAAKARGRKGGRKRSLSAEQAALALDMMKDGSRSMAQVAKMMNVPVVRPRLPWRPSRRGRRTGGGDEGGLQHSSEPVSAWGGRLRHRIADRTSHGPGELGIHQMGHDSR
jgi:DNA invertase Pin-like site-specific DNA recombinase